MPGLAFELSFCEELEFQAQSIGQLWRETLRYHKNEAYLYELLQVREAVEWFLDNYEAL